MILNAEFKEINHAFGADLGKVAVIDTGKDAIRYTKQNLTEAQKAQARANIGIEIDDGERSAVFTSIVSAERAVVTETLNVWASAPGNKSRAMTNPIGVVCKKGVTYKVSRTSDNYFFGACGFVLASADGDLSLAETDSYKIFPQITANKYDSGWLIDTKEFEYTATDDNTLLSVYFNCSEKTITAEMLDEILNTFSITWNEGGGGINVNVGADTKEELTSAQVENCKEYAMHISEAKGEVESFVFFTDPHFGFAEELRDFTENHLQQISNVYHNTPTSMCVCGGDWLNNNNTKENACWQLGVYDGRMKALFDRYVMVVGNHDTNYQGYEYMQSGYDQNAHKQCILSKETMRNLWHRKQGASYFVVDGDNTTFYVFDTGLDWYTDMDDYRWDQVDWFANKLLTDKPKRCVALVHIAESYTPFIDAITKVANAYNNKTSVTLNGVTYNFASATGRFYFVLGGHSHADNNYTVNSIPVVTTVNADVDESVATFDLVLVDYNANKMHMVRVGTGNSRSISIGDA